MATALQFQIVIRAPRPIVWEQMLGDRGYRDWTSAFCAGSYFEGRWETGAEMRFLGPSGEGMRARIEAARHPEFVSIQHLGELRASEPVAGDDWLGAFERYRLSELPDGGTRVDVELSGVPDRYVDMMATLWPQALERLRSISETG